MYSTARLYIYERRKIRKIFRRWRELNPVQKDMQSWPPKANNLHLCRELNPEPHAPKSVIVRFELWSLDFPGQRKFASCLAAFHDPSGEDFK